MQLIFVDESTPEEWFVLGAFAIDASNWYGLEEDIMDVVGLDIDNLKELRWTEGSITREVSESLSFDVYDYLDASVPYTVWGVLIDTDAQDLSESQAHKSALVLLFERLQMYLDRQDEVGAVFIDSNEEVANELRETDYRLKQHGTFYQDIDRLVGVLTPIKDEHSIGVQLADWVAAAIQAYYIRDIEKYYNRIESHLDRHPTTGDISGVGIKITPDDSAESLMNSPD